MSQELHYTSVARGLKPGSRGFGTVAATADLPEMLADRLESLSAYRAVHPPGDPSAALNPVAYLHVRLTVTGNVLDVLSRIGPAGLDYSGRPNKYAHHVVLEPEERPEGGPAWLLSQPGFIQSAWEGEPRLLSGGRQVPQGDRPAGVAQAWHTLTGDAGWAGVLAEAFLADPRRPVFLVFRPGMELLPLFVEAIALLPPSRRWDVEFSTYLTTLAPGVSCTWRGVLDGSAEAKNARRLPNALIVDLCRPIGPARGGALVHLARTGERREMPGDIAHPPGISLPGPNRHAAVTAGPPPPAGSTTRGPRADANGDHDWLPDLAARLAAGESLLGDDRAVRRRRPRQRVVALVIAACLIPLVAAGVFWSPAARRRLGLESPIPAPSEAARSDEVRPRPRPQIAARDEEPPNGDPIPSIPIEVARKIEPASSTDNRAKPAELEAEKKAIAEAKPVASGLSKPDARAPRAPAEPAILAFNPPEVPRSSLGSRSRQEPEIRLPEDAEDRLELLNAPGLRVDAVGSPKGWQVTTRTGSGLGGGFPLARLYRVDARTWRFDWAKDAKAQATQVERLKDAILQLRSGDGRPIYILLRGLDLRADRPLVVWEKQKILFDRLDPRTRSVSWAGDDEAVDGTHWKPRIRRARVVITSAGDDLKAGEIRRRVVEPVPVEGAKDAAAPTSFESELIPGEVKLRLTIDPSSPGSIDVRVEPDRERVREGRDRRAARRKELEEATPKDEDGDPIDPIEFRRGELRKLREDGAKKQEQIETMEREIAELEQMNEIHGTEDLLSRPARVELSVVIGLDVEGPGILDIVKIGDVSGAR